MILTDNLNTKTDYLRISVTDRCNLRCIYCMPQEGIVNKPQEELLTFEEITRLVRILVSLGISKIRLTGGEPLIRKGIINLIGSLAEIEGIEEVSLTTNGALLSFYADELKKAGLNRINISLDTLKEAKFKKITRNSSFYNVIKGIDEAKKTGFYPLKLNMVVMKGVNDDEIIDFVKFASSKELILRFIEFMNVTPLWNQERFMSIEEVKRICEGRFKLSKIGGPGPGPAAYYNIDKEGIVGFINTSEDNCRRCNRLRLTSTGELKICLYEPQGLCLRSLLREGMVDHEIEDIIKMRLGLKRNIDYTNGETSQVYMCKVGG